MKRQLQISPAIAMGQRDFLLLYYYYLRNTRRNYTSPGEDPMLKFMPTSAGQKESNIEKFVFSVGGFGQRGNIATPTEDVYDLWTRSFISVTPEENTRFYGNIGRGDQALSINLPRGLMWEQEKTYRRVIKSPAVLDRLSDFEVFTTRDEFPEDESYPNQRPPLSPEAARFMGAILNESIYPSTLMFQDVWEDDPFDFTDIHLRFLWENIKPSQPGRNTYATLRDLLGTLESESTGDMRDDSQPRTLRAKPLYRAVTNILSIDDIVVMLSTDAVDTPSKKEWEYFKTNQYVPFAIQGYTRPWLDQRQFWNGSNRDFESQLEPEYVLFRNMYESQVADSNVPETAIPNIYVYNLAARSKNSGWGGNNTLRVPEGIFKEQVPDDRFDPPVLRDVVPGDVMNTAHNSQSEYLKMLALGRYPQPIDPKYIYGTNWTSQPGELSDDIGIREGGPGTYPISIGDYFKQYSSKIQENTTAGNASKTIIIPATDFELLEDIEKNKRKFPMNIGVQFFRENSTNLSNEGGEDQIQINQSANILEENRYSTTFLAALAPSGTAPTNRQCQVRSDILRDRPGNYNRSTPLFNKSRWGFSGDLKFYDFEDVGTYGSNHDGQISPLIITQKCLERATGEFVRTGESQQEVITDLQAVGAQHYKTYEQILGLDAARLGDDDAPTPTKSEVIGYKIEKREVTSTPDGPRSTSPGEIIQTIMLGNPAGDPITTYIDTQVKYGKSYFYSLSEYRITYSTEYEFLVLEYQGPDLEGNSRSAWETLGEEWDQVVGDPQSIRYGVYVIRRPKIQIMEVPLYDRQFYDSTLSNNDFLFGGLSYPICSVRDYPPTPPELNVTPIMGNPNQIKLKFTPTIGDYTNTKAIENLIVPTSGSLMNRQNVRAHQLRHDYFGRRNYFWNRVSCRGEGQSEVTRMRVYRTTQMNPNPTNRQELYDSFDPGSNPNAVVGRMVNTLYDPSAEPEQGEVAVLSYNTIDTIESNTYYYYTCVAVDAHDNVSVPSEIYRVRLVFEKGLLIPEVEIYDPPLLKPQVPSRDFARFIKIKSSGIQSFPYTETNDSGETTSIRSLGSAQRKSITANNFVVRLTSKDTGKKFDLHLSFNNEDTRIATEEGADDAGESPDGY